MKFPRFHARPTLTWHFSPEASSSQRPVIVMIHNFGGTEDNLLKHIQLINELGFDGVSFDLSWHKNSDPRIFFKRLRKAWAEEIKAACEEVLDKRHLILFSFSGLGACSLDAIDILLNHHTSRIKGLIFDSGPFDENETCVRNMLHLYYGVKSSWLRNLASRIMVRAWDPQNSQTTQMRIQSILNKNPNLPILSLQAARDKIVPLGFIQSCFARLKQNSPKYKEIVFDLGGHLTSFKEEPQKYREALRNFLFD